MLVLFKKYIGFALILAIIVMLFYGLFRIYKHERSQRIRLQGNQEILLSNLRSYKLSDSSSAATTGRLQLTVQELKDAQTGEMIALKNTIEKLEIKLRHVTSATTTNFETVTTLNTHLRDSVIYDTIPIKYFNRSTRFNDVSLQIFPTFHDSLYLRVVTRDTMTQVVHQIPRGIRFWKPKRYEQTVRFANPDTRIHYSRYLEIRKR